MVMTRIGGYGNLAHGRHKYGGADSLDFQDPPQPLGPRFSYALPSSGTHNVSLEQWIVYDLYYYSSTLGTDYTLTPAVSIVEISEDEGVTWLDALAAPYSTTFGYIDGQTVRFRIHKTIGVWADDSKILIRTTQPDEYGQPMTDTPPVRWG